MSDESGLSLGRTFQENPRFRDIFWTNNDESSQCAGVVSADGKRWVLTVAADGYFQIHQYLRGNFKYCGQGHTGVLLRPGRDPYTYLEKAKLRVYGQWRRLCSHLNGTLDNPL